MSRDITIITYVGWDTEGYLLSRYIYICWLTGGILRYIEGYNRISRDIEGYQRISKDIERYRGISMIPYVG